MTEAETERLATILRHKPMTAKQIARLLRVSKPTAYARIRALAVAGYLVGASIVEGRKKTGPAPLVYRIRS